MNSGAILLLRSSRLFQRVFSTFKRPVKECFLVKKSLANSHNPPHVTSSTSLLKNSFHLSTPLKSGFRVKSPFLKANNLNSFKNMSAFRKPVLVTPSDSYLASFISSQIDQDFYKNTHDQSFKEKHAFSKDQLLDQDHDFFLIGIFWTHAPWLCSLTIRCFGNLLRPSRKCRD
ncbi:hypothetical protein O181_020166 [Austropuccinia psidii MF-1]|uniref:Uncharacterized protein n=1 Tax=Austropuccinia psidii MF-1 TaxID=1389203 RepID=A0A9Q3C8J9_9BASI|nr:hypothetical protein [Austropuccinia psidii MF-1]